MNSNQIPKDTPPSNNFETPTHTALHLIAYLAKKYEMDEYDVDQLLNIISK